MTMTIFTTVLMGCAAVIGIADDSPNPFPARGDRTWIPLEVFSRTDAIVVATRGRYYTSVRFKNGDGRFIGEGRARYLEISEPVVGDIEPDSAILFFQPPAGIHEFAGMVDGEMLFFLRKLSAQEVANVNSHVGENERGLPDDEDVWTFATERAQWLSRAVLPPNEVADPLVAELNRVAGVEPDRESIVNYIRKLAELWQRAGEGEKFETEALDPFQQNVVQHRSGMRPGQQKDPNDQ